MENQNNQSRRAIPIYYTNVYNIIIQSKMLGRIERELAILFASYGPVGGCNWSQASLCEYCECGPNHLRRALKRLQYWRMIKIVRGGWSQKGDEPRRETNRYVFEKDPYKWKVTKEIQEKIIQETLNMKMEPPPFEHEPFPNMLGFEISFQSSFPKLAEARKGRKKSSSKQVPESSELGDEKRWNTKIARLFDENLRLTYLLSSYYYHYNEIELARNTDDHGYSELMKNYFEKLHYIYATRVNGPMSSDEEQLMKKVNDWQSSGMTFANISHELMKLDQENKKTAGCGQERKVTGH